MKQRTRDIDSSLKDGSGERAGHAHGPGRLARYTPAGGRTWQRSVVNPDGWGNAPVSMIPPGAIPLPPPAADLGRYPPRLATAVRDVSDDSWFYSGTCLLTRPVPARRAKPHRRQGKHLRRAGLL